MNIKSRNIKKTILLFLSLLFGGNLAILCLFNLPIFYEQDTLGFMEMFLAVFVVFSLAIGFSYKLLSAPLRHFKDRNVGNITLITLLSFLLISIFYFTSSYYWSVPKFHRVEICYQSSDLSGELKILKISDYLVGSAYSAETFGYKEYPISILTNTCITGGVRTVQKWEGILVDLEKKNSDDFITIEINHRVTRLALSDHDGVVDKEAIHASIGNGNGVPVYPDVFSNKALIFIKWVSLILSSVCLAFLVFALSEIIIFHNDQKIISHKTVLAIVIVYFMVFGFLMTNHGGQPDQGKHVYFSSRYSETWGFPEEDLQSEFFVQDNVYFYYWINGAAIKLFHLFASDAGPNPTTLQGQNLILTRIDILILRLLSVVISAGTLFYIYKLTSKVSGNKFGGTLAAFFAANTLMFIFISGGISFDNFLGLSSVAAIYHMTCILEREDYVKNTSLLGIWLCLGAITKNEGVLLAFIIFLIWLTYSFLNRKTLKFKFAYLNIILILILVFASGLFLELYGGNLIKYHRPLPKCYQIKPAEICTRFSYRIAQRQELALSQLWSERNTIIGPFEYAYNYWLFNMINGIWGIISHNTYVPKFLTSLHGYLIIWGILCTARYWKKEDVVSSVLLIIVAGYVGYLFYFNYFNELEMGFRHYAVQGRYAFPILSAFFALMVNYFLKIRPLFFRKMTISLAMILYFAGGLGVFVFNYSEVFVSWRIFFSG